MARNVQLGRQKPRSAISNALVASWSARVALSGRPRATSMTPLTKLQVPRGNSAFSSNAVAYPSSASTSASPSSPLSIRAHDRVSWKYSSIVGNSSVHCGAVARCSSANRDRSIEMPGSRVLDHGRECSGRHHGRDRVCLAVHPLATADDNRGTPTFENGTSTGVAHLFERFAQHPFRIRQPPEIGGSTRRPRRWRSPPAGDPVRELRASRNASSASSARFWSLSAAPSTYRGLDLGAGLGPRHTPAARRRSAPKAVAPAAPPCASARAGYGRRLRCATTRCGSARLAIRRTSPRPRRPNRDAPRRVASMACDHEALHRTVDARA